MIKYGETFRQAIAYENILFSENLPFMEFVNVMLQCKPSATSRKGMMQAKKILAKAETTFEAKS